MVHEVLLLHAVEQGCAGAPGVDGHVLPAVGLRREWNARLLQDAGQLTEDKISQLDLDKSVNAFTESEQLALEYADKMATDHHNMDDVFFDRLGQHYNDEQILELGMMIGQFIGFGRLLMVLDLESKFCEVSDA